MARTLGAAALLALSLATGPAAAQWPASVKGTWSVVTGVTAAQLSIASQAGGTGCVGIGGSITDSGGAVADKIQGFYCSETGRIVFARQVGTTNKVSGVYSGSLGSGTPLGMAGTFAQDIRIAGAELGEVGFHAQK